MRILFERAAARRRARGVRSGVAALEFALVAIPFFTMLLFLFAIGFNLFWQEALSNGLHAAVRQLQTGQAQNLADGNAFVNSYLCPDSGGLLNCGGLSVNVQKIQFASGQDYKNYVNTSLATGGGTLDLTAFAPANYCNAGPSEFILVTAVYVMPSIMGNLLPGVLSVKYNGQPVSAIMAEVAAYTENFTQPGAQSGAPAC
jgi:Flp pilus assembly protein TadG